MSDVRTEITNLKNRVSRLEGVIIDLQQENKHVVNHLQNLSNALGQMIAQAQAAAGTNPEEMAAKAAEELNAKQAAMSVEGAVQGKPVLREVSKPEEAPAV